MPILPLFNQFVLPTLVSLYAVLTSFFPQTSLHSKTEVKTVVEKKIVSPKPSKSPTPIEKEKVVMHTSQQELSHGSVSEEKKENKDSSLPNSTSNVSVTTASTNPPPSQTKTATTTISASGKTIHLIMKYPSIGGNIIGTMSGDCNGTISGVYDGPSRQTLSGKGSASCPIGFISIPVDITYAGKLISSTDAQITYSVNALSKTEFGNTTLSLSE